MDGGLRDLAVNLSLLSPGRAAEITNQTLREFTTVMEPRGPTEANVRPIPWNPPEDRQTRRRGVRGRRAWFQSMEKTERIKKDLLNKLSEVENYRGLFYNWKFEHNSYRHRAIHPDMWMTMNSRGRPREIFTVIVKVGPLDIAELQVRIKTVEEMGLTIELGDVLVQNYEEARQCNRDTPRGGVARDLLAIYPPVCEVRCKRLILPTSGIVAGQNIDQDFTPAGPVNRALLTGEETLAWGERAGEEDFQLFTNRFDPLPHDRVLNLTRHFYRLLGYDAVRYKQYTKVTLPQGQREFRMLPGDTINFEGNGNVVGGCAEIALNRMDMYKRWAIDLKHPHQSTITSNAINPAETYRTLSVNDLVRNRPLAVGPAQSVPRYHTLTGDIVADLNEIRLGRITAVTPYSFDFNF